MGLARARFTHLIPALITLLVGKLLLALDANGRASDVLCVRVVLHLPCVVVEPVALLAVLFLALLGAGEDGEDGGGRGRGEREGRTERERRRGGGKEEKGEEREEHKRRERRRSARCRWAHLINLFIL